MFGIGLPEMLLILALALIVVGPDKLPDLARSIAKGILELKKTAEGLKDSFSEETQQLTEIQPNLENAAKAFKEHVLDLEKQNQAHISAQNVNAVELPAAPPSNDLLTPAENPAESTAQSSTEHPPQENQAASLEQVTEKQSANLS